MAKKAKPKRTTVAVEVLEAYRAQELLNEANAAERSDTVKGQPYGTKKSPKLLEAFLVWLRKGYSPKFAAAKCGIARETFFKWKKNDEEFAEAWKLAIDEGTDHFEDEARRRAVEGVARPVFQMGGIVGHVQEYSDSLLAMQLKGRRPERYSDKVEHGGPGGGPVKFEIEVVFVQPKGK